MQAIMQAAGVPPGSPLGGGAYNAPQILQLVGIKCCCSSPQRPFLFSAFNSGRSTTFRQTDRHVDVASTRYAIASRLKSSGKPSGVRASIPNPVGGAHSALQTSQRTSPPLSDFASSVLLQR